MADRAAKRQRRTSTSTSTDNDDYSDQDETTSAAPTASSTRPRRGTANAATIQRSSPEETRQSIHLTVKSSPNKLRQATTATAAPVAKAALSSRNIVSGKRASRSSRVVREVDTDEDEDEDEDEAEEADAMDLDDDDDDEEDDDEDAEGTEDDDMDAEGDEDDMDDDTPRPRTVIPKSSVLAKPTISVTKAQDSVEAKELALDDDDDDDDLSDPDSDLDDEDALGEDDDAEGEDDDENELTRGIDDDVDMDSDGDLSRDQTPDITKLTRRQRAIVADEADTVDGSLLALSNEAQKKKHLTAEEHAMRRAEMARRRKNLSEKRNEEEKLDTINRLLKKQPPKRGRRTEITESAQEDEPEQERANPLYVRYIQNAQGTTLAVPDEWLQAPAGRVLSGETQKMKGEVKMAGRMVMEVA